MDSCNPSISGSHVFTHQPCRANPGSEFVLANTLAKWKKLEPNNFDFSQVSVKKVYQEVVLYFEYGMFLQSEGIIKTISENLKASQNTLFANM